jgi:hypothetical protein
VFAITFILKRLLCLSYLYLAIKGVWWACWGVLNLEFSLVKLVYHASVNVATCFIQTSLARVFGANLSYLVFGLRRASSALLGSRCALTQVLAQQAVTSHRGAGLRANTFNATYADSGI